MGSFLSDSFIFFLLPQRRIRKILSQKKRHGKDVGILELSHMELCASSLVTTDGEKIVGPQNNLLAGRIQIFFCSGDFVNPFLRLAIAIDVLQMFFNTRRFLLVF